MLDALNTELRDSLGKQVNVIKEGFDRYPVLTPFDMDDGDGFNIVLKGSEQGNNWLLTDEGSTLMHLSYWIDYNLLNKGTRKRIIDDIVTTYGVSNVDGILSLSVMRSEIGHGLITFIRALSRIVDIEFLNRETVRATFKEDWKQLMRTVVPSSNLEFDYSFPDLDPNKIYSADALVKTSHGDYTVFAVGNDTRCRDVTITLHQYSRWELPNQSVVMFQNQQSIGRDVLARLSDVADKQFSSVVASQPDINNYFRRRLNGLNSNM